MMEDDKPLTQGRVHAAVDEACAFTEENHLARYHPWTLRIRRGTQADFPIIVDLLKSNTAKQPLHDPIKPTITSQWNPQTCRLDVPNSFGLVLLKDIEDDQSQCVGLVTGYFAYSTWDGRVLYLDKLLLPAIDNDEFSTKAQDALLWTLQYTLVDIALRTKCARYTWQHHVPSPTYPSGDAIQPDLRHGWLSLHLPLQEDVDGRDHEAVWTAASDRAAILACLDRFQKKMTKNLLQVRLASSGQDVAIIERLVRELAEYEKEPESVKIHQEHYTRDGFSCDGEQHPPLFHCFLLENGNVNTINSTKEKNGQVCGMAFCYFGYALGEGRFLYLEDLFLEKESRGLGGGSLMMKVLADVARSTSCVRMVWQALDWNTPALEFYDKKIGAKVQGGLFTSRFAREGLSWFHSTRKDCSPNGLAERSQCIAVPSL